MPSSLQDRLRTAPVWPSRVARQADLATSQIRTCLSLPPDKVHQLITRMLLAYKSNQAGLLRSQGTIMGAGGTKMGAGATMMGVTCSELRAVLAIPHQSTHGLGVSVQFRLLFTLVGVPHSNLPPPPRITKTTSILPSRPPSERDRHLGIIRSRCEQFAVLEPCQCSHNVRVRLDGVLTLLFGNIPHPHQAIVGPPS